MRYVALFALIGLTFTACRMDDDNMIELLPVKVADVPGEYTGKTVIRQDNLSKNYPISFDASADAIVFEDFPLEQIVSSIIADPIEVKETLDALQNVSYTMGYTAELASHEKEVLLSLEMQALQFEMPIDGETKMVVVHFKEKGFGTYYATSMGRELYLGFEANKIEVDGTELPTINPINFLVGGLRK